MRKMTRERTQAALAELSCIRNEQEAPVPQGYGATARYMIELPERARRERESLVEKSRRFDGALPVRKLDVASVHPSNWASRHEGSFASPAYLALKAEISSCEGNVQPIKVRPMRSTAPGQSLSGVLNGTTPVDAHAQQYEIVYGYRRHRACLELGLPVLALIEDLSDAHLFAQMNRENRQRHDLSPWEQGMMFSRALESGLFPSMRQLARSVGCTSATVSRAISLTRLPEEIVHLFASPAQLKSRWAKPLHELTRRDSSRVIERVRRRLKGGQLASREIFSALTATSSLRVHRKRKGSRVDSTSAILCLRLHGRRVGEVLHDPKHGPIVRFDGAVPVALFSEVAKGIQHALDHYRVRARVGYLLS